MAALRLGILGGTFDPPHLGHLVAAECAREQLGLERVLFVPAGEPWRKAGTYVSPPEQRMEMTRLAIAGNERFVVSGIEQERQGPTYTVETLRAVADEHAGTEIVFLVGIDALMDLPNWHQAAEIPRLAYLGATARSGRTLDEHALDGLLPGLAERVLWFAMPQMDISGTELRSAVAAGRSIKYVVPTAVEAYIARHNLYTNM